MITLSRPTGKGSSNKFNLRLFNECTDSIPVHKLIHKTIEISFPAYYEEAVLRHFKELHTFDTIVSRAKAGKTLVYSLNNKIVGTGSFNDSTIHSLFVDPAHQNKGIGKKILLALIENLKAERINSLVIAAPPGSTYFFNKNGFEVIRETTLTIDTTVSYHFYQMELHITH